MTRLVDTSDKRAEAAEQAYTALMVAVEAYLDVTIEPAREEWKSDTAYNAAVVAYEGLRAALTRSQILKGLKP